MAGTIKFISACVLLAVLMFCYGITSTEERVLKEHGEEDLTENNGYYYNNISTTKYERTVKLGRIPVVHVNGKARPTSEPYNYHTSGTVDDFRPTDPGHSPGAGHSKGPGSISPNNETDLN